jgi:hypothetical protein
VKPLRLLIAGLAAAVAWLAGLQVFFGPAQRILTDPGLQSPKFLAAFAREPFPRMAEAWVLPAGLLVIGLIHATAYAWLAPRLDGPPWRRGLAFGALAWALMVPWFEFYLPWNVMREPFPLVMLEAACWAGVLLLVGLATGLAYGRPRD